LSDKKGFFFVFHSKRKSFDVSNNYVVIEDFKSKEEDICRSVVVIMDDTLLTGTAIEEHDRMLNEMLSRLHHNNLKLSKEKCKIRQERSVITCVAS
jgi:hypothetical protein